MAREDDVRKIVTGGRARGLSDDQIRSLVAKYDARQTQQTQPLETQAAPAESWTDTAINALPTIGGTVGSFAGAGKWNPIGMAGAAVGGAAGEAFKQTANALRGRIDLVPRSIPEQLSSIASAGAVQGGLEGVGRGVVAPLAKGVYGLAMRPLKAVRDKYGLGTLVNEGFERGIMPTKGGAAKATAQMQASKATQRGMAAQFDQANPGGVQVADAVRSGVRPLLKEATQQEAATGVTGARQKILGNVKTVTKKNQPRVPAAKMMDLKHAADDIADPAYAAARQPGGVPVMPGSEAAIAKGFSKGYRNTLNDAVGPEFARQGLTTKALYGVGRMAHEAAERPNMATNIMSTVAGAASSGGDITEGVKDAITYRALMSPTLWAGGALAAQPLALYGTRALDAATGSNGEALLRKALMDALTGQQDQ